MLDSGCVKGIDKKGWGKRGIFCTLEEGMRGSCRKGFECWWKEGKGELDICDESMLERKEIEGREVMLEMEGRTGRDCMEEDCFTVPRENSWGEICGVGSETIFLDFLPLNVETFDVSSIQRNVGTFFFGDGGDWKVGKDFWFSGSLDLFLFRETCVGWKTGKEKLVKGVGLALSSSSKKISGSFVEVGLTILSTFGDGWWEEWEDTVIVGPQIKRDSIPVFSRDCSCLELLDGEFICKKMCIF